MKILVGNLLTHSLGGEMETKVNFINPHNAEKYCEVLNDLLREYQDIYRD